ncbi:hypothetical protein HOU03_gp256 [Caulobacter phage CcrSC]|uniref:Uncharacterized protein n=1 Tax=Caulobacter phage CcrSC TaxID=2283272 RepID=A0A385EGD4_9CAUD|nr:hypothetical protein HOU03_gp256 [Caulobacter phage CcrSC]AXQ70012.1 hypothetical protein CcrSC_gp430 [Caulobacter phage CcrSC]
MADHRFNVLTPIVEKVREKTDLKAVRKALWFEQIARLEARVREAPDAEETQDWLLAEIVCAAYYTLRSTLGGKQLRADAFRRLIYLRSQFA